MFEESQGEIAWDDAIQGLAEIFTEHALSEEFDLPDSDFTQASRRELRDWIKRGLVVEREGKLLATDALQKAFNFVDSLDDEVMTSTASRLATVQREIENLEAKLNPAPASRAIHLKKRIASLENELAQVERGEFEILSGIRAQEGIREVYQLALSLRADFRRVEDSYREADRQLRHEIVRSDQNRGSVLDSMLDGHDALLKTAEGQVFDGFYEQLGRSVELDQMKAQLKTILTNAAASEALNRRQSTELRWLVPGLVRESERVIQARARGERDVRGFIKAGLANEHHRVGALLNDILETAIDIDWSSTSVRRTPGPLPPIAIAVSLLPLIQRLRFKEESVVEGGDLDLGETNANLDDLGEDFWAAFDGLDRQALFESTLDYLRSSKRSCSIGELAEALPPTHDLETLGYWLGIAREAEVPFDEGRESIDLGDPSGNWTRFSAPHVLLDASALEQIQSDTLG
jgi:polyhydroxyalkanoate synthesis regulator phasin